MRIVVVGGASGGHVYPAWALAETLVRDMPGADVYGLFPEKLFFPFNFGDLPGWTVYRVPGIGLNLRRPWNYPAVALSWLRLYRGICDVMRSIRPQVIVSFGTFMTAAVAVWARRHGVPMITHEQNVMLGRANRWALGHIKKLAIGMPVSVDMDRLNRRKDLEVRFTGQLIRGTFKGRPVPAEASSRADARPFCLLVLGGSQGAHLLNEHIFHTIDGMDDFEKRRLSIIHLTGKEDEARAKAFYGDRKITHEVRSFAHDMASCYEKATAVIARAGAGTIAEVAAFGRPLILIPYASSHQRENARWLVARQAALSIDLIKESEDNLRNSIRHLMSDPGFRHALGAQLKNVIQCQGAEELKKWIMELLVRPAVHASCG